MILLDLRRLSIMFSAFIFAVLCFGSSFTAFAEDQQYSLTVKFVTEEFGAIPDCQFELYYALSPDGTLFGDFADLKVEVGDLSSSENVSALESTLAAYVDTGFTEDIDEVGTNALGEAKFEDLDAGIYLVVGSSAKVNGILYTPKPALIRIPGHDMQGELVKDVVATVKYDRLVLPPEPVSRTVTKVWDDNNFSDRPTSVTVQLLKDGEKYDEQALSADNNWTYTWNELDPTAEWSVIETNIPNGYKVTISIYDNNFTVVNKGNTIVTPSPQGTGNGGEGNDRPTLPQTGQLWWPVPILLASGCVLLLIGIISRRLSDDNVSD